MNKKRKFLLFEEARSIVNTLGLKDIKEWVEYSKTKRPKNIPSNPNTKYKDSGWIDWYDWLGKIKNYFPKKEKIKKSKYLSFEEAREYVRNLDIKTYSGWFEYWKNNIRPIYIPFSPDRVYKDMGWNGWNDWLGNGKIKLNKDFFLYEECKEFIKEFNIKSSKDWDKNRKELKKINNKIPSTPDKYYKNSGWINWPSFLENNYKSTKDIIFVSYEECKEFVKNLNINKSTDWFNHFKENNRPENIPSSPNKVYKDKGWISWKEFLNTTFLSLEDAKVVIREYNIKSSKDWNNKYKEIKLKYKIPSTPTIYYNISWDDFLGTSNKIVLLSFEEARKYVRELNLKYISDWEKYKRSGNKPSNIPSNPNEVYKNKGWTNWPDFLGNNDIILNYSFLSFENARDFIRNLNLKYLSNWEIYKKSGNKPSNIPSNPNRVYKNKGWTNWPDFLGNDNINVENIINNQQKEYNFICFEEAKKYIRKLDLKTSRDWLVYKSSNNRPNYIPAHPDRVYKNEWISWTDWLGYKFETFDQVSIYCLRNNITTAEVYYKHLEENPDCGLPYNPIKYYNIKEEIL